MASDAAFGTLPGGTRSVKRQASLAQRLRMLVERRTPSLVRGLKPALTGPVSRPSFLPFRYGRWSAAHSVRRSDFDVTPAGGRTSGSSTRAYQPRKACALRDRQVTSAPHSSRSSPSGRALDQLPGKPSIAPLNNGRAATIHSVLQLEEPAMPSRTRIMLFILCGIVYSSPIGSFGSEALAQSPEDRCSDIVKFGVYDFTSSGSNASTKSEFEDFLKYLRSKTEESSFSFRDFVGAITPGGLFVQNQETNWNSAARELTTTESHVRNLTESQFADWFQSSRVNSDLVRAWSDCMEAQRQESGYSWSVQPLQGETELLVTFRFDPPFPTCEGPSGMTTLALENATLVGTLPTQIRPAESVTVRFSRKATLPTVILVDTPGFPRASVYWPRIAPQVMGGMGGAAISFPPGYRVTVFMRGQKEQDKHILFSSNAPKDSFTFGGQCTLREEGAGSGNYRFFPDREIQSAQFGFATASFGNTTIDFTQSLVDGRGLPLSPVASRIAPFGGVILRRGGSDSTYDVSVSWMPID